MNGELPAHISVFIERAIGLVRLVPGYATQATALKSLLVSHRIRYIPTLEDRAHAGLLGTITLGPEPFAPNATVLGLAETLIHELHHLGQNPLEKTASFWKGVFTQTDVMMRYERPAYLAAIRFLQAYHQAFPEAEAVTRAEIYAVNATFQTAYGEPLSGVAA